ncbi:salt tolerance receptor-like cytoplasmic kinase 1 [Nymphaea colorata]|nr:salt tolerance receptor-like cytoplasmic kinase 1 [Nymphaea colorata]
MALPRAAFVHFSSCAFLLVSLFAHSLASNEAFPPSSNTDRRRALFARERLPIILGLIFGSVFVALTVLMAVCFMRLRRKKPGNGKDAGDEEKETTKNGKTVGSEESVVVVVVPAKSGSEVKRMSWAEVRRITDGFASAVGEGGFSTVYRARLGGSGLGAAKVIRSSERLNREFRQELDVLLQVRHDNIVKLLGYCDETEEGVLLFELAANGNLHERLHGKKEGEVLTWQQRKSIAVGVARAIEHLHDGCDSPVVHCDIKSSNVLLDERLAPKLCDFGSARVGFSSTVLRPTASPVMGSPGYVDPYYLRTGLASKKTDIYSFGVLLLEIVTGIEPFCSETERLLTRVVADVVRDPARAPEIVDPQLTGRFDPEEARAVVSVAASCLRDQPALRPSMAEVAALLADKATAAFSVAGKLCGPSVKGEGMER